MGCIDMNVWYSRVDKPERPDFVLFDLDPSPDVGFKETVQVALLIKEVLDALGLEGYPKTSGVGRDPRARARSQRRYTYADTREFAEIVARTLARTHRGLVTTEWSKAKRRGVLIDANQNGEGKTIASVYSVRPREGAPVSTPLRWDEVTEELDPRRLHDGGRPRPRRAATATSSRPCSHGAPVARRGAQADSLSPKRAGSSSSAVDLDRDGRAPVVALDPEVVLA